MKLTGLFTLLLLFGCFIACQPERKAPPAAPDPFAHITDPEVRSLLQKAIVRAGGMTVWNSMRELHFKKNTSLYDSTGAVEQESLQDHDYTFRPAEQIRISWLDDGATQRILYQNGKVVKETDGEVDTTANLQALLNSVQSATFVISIPFKLLDEGTNLSYAGLDTLEDERVVEVLQATYDPAEYDQHTTPDIWWHYFDANDYTQLGYLVQHADHYSYVRNLEFTMADSLLLPTVRESYRVDSLHNKLYLRAKYRYTDYEVVPGTPEQ